MPVDAQRRKLLYKVAMAYYEDALTQEVIAGRFGLSRIKVSRLLRQARQERIVQIAIIPPQDPKPDLERQIEERFGLQEVVVVTPSSDDPVDLLRNLGQAGADYLVRCLQGQEVIGISWGRTLGAVVEALPAENWPEMRVVQIIGGLGQPEAETHGADLTRRMADAFNARPVMLSAPGIVASKLVRNALLADPQISETLALAARADVALVGIGAPAPDALVRTLGAVLTAVEIERLQARGAVGDIALRFFDGNGQAVVGEINDRIIGLDIAQIRRIGRVVGVAGGKDKLGVIRAAARGGLIGVLITDEQTAVGLLGGRDKL